MLDAGSVRGINNGAEANKQGKRSTKGCPWSIYDYKKQPQLSDDDQLLPLSVWIKTVTVNMQ